MPTAIPIVLVVGGGQAGLSIAARLKQLQVDTLIVDRWPRIGDNWRQRYHALTLHNQVQVNHLPYMPFPPNWPVYIPKDKLANWFEAYVEAMELNYWTGTEFESGAYDEARGRWSVVLRRADGSDAQMHPRHVVMATGVSGIPNLPDIPALKNFAGKVLHSSQYDDGEAWQGKTRAGDRHRQQRPRYRAGPVFERRRGDAGAAQPDADHQYRTVGAARLCGLQRGHAGGQRPDRDLDAAALAKRSHVMLTEQSKKLDQALLDGLARKGFKLDFGEGNTGWQFKYLTRGGGYYFNVGCSDLVVERRDRADPVLRHRTLCRRGRADEERRDARRRPDRAGDRLQAQEVLVRKLFGDEVAGRVGPIWGFGEGQELRNMYTRTAAARPLVHRRQPRAMPHQFEISGAADQGDRARLAAAGRTPSASPLLVIEDFAGR